MQKLLTGEVNINISPPSANVTSAFFIHIYEERQRSRAKGENVNEQQLL